MEKLTSYCVIALLAICTMVFFNYSGKSQILGIAKENTDYFPFKEYALPDFPNNTCTITDYGATTDPLILNTRPIQAAIDDCSKEGGSVIIPEGKWFTGGLKMKSHVNLKISRGAELVFSTNPKDYLPAVFTRLEGLELYNYSPLIYADGIENAAITGKGRLNGKGDEWENWRDEEKDSLEKAYEMAQNDVPVANRIFGKEKYSLRPSFIQFVNSKNIWLEDFTLTDGPKWGIHPLYSENVFISNVKIKTDGPNSDGIVIDSSKNVLVENSVLETGDDSIAIKSGLDNDGWRVNRPSEDIIIRDIEINDGHSGVAIGSEMSGGVRNVLVRNLNIDDVDRGIRVKSLRGRGGFVENIWIEKIIIKKADRVGIEIDLTYDSSTVESEAEKIPVVKNFQIKDVRIEETQRPLRLEGIGAIPIEKVLFSNITTENSEEGILVRNSKDVEFQNVTMEKLEKKPLFDIENSENISH
ncbi:MAG: Glycoside hydrolase family 28 [Candidatus Moranbacteria bacterium GW2011_GWE2_47_10]|nr:MAG: Glycoside hydrolase family 28 [Candidatus Moranbacteria bacterium GW2011_GWE2_47_10]